MRLAHMVLVSGLLAQTGLMAGGVLVLCSPVVDPLFADLAKVAMLLVVLSLVSQLALAILLHKEMCRVPDHSAPRPLADQSV